MNSKTRLLTLSVMFAAINYVAFAYGKISIPTSPTTNTAIHVANAVVVLSAWLIGPLYGGLAGAIGLSIADFMDPRYILSAPKTFIMKFLIAWIAGTTAKKMRLKEKTETKDITRITLISAIAALGFNVIVDPVFGYLYKKFILRMSIEAATIMVTWTAGVTFLNAVICVIVSVLLYRPLHRMFRDIDD